MKWKYGNYTHPTGEVNVTLYQKRGVFSNRDRTAYREVRITGTGLICAGSESAVQQRVEEIYEAYRYDYKSGGLLHTDGTQTKHWINNSDTLDGVKVVDLSFPESQPGEYATYRTFRVTLAGTYPAVHDSDDQILWYDETIQSIGVGGFHWVMMMPRIDYPAPRIIADQMPQEIIQRGSSCGYGAWVSDMGPHFSNFENTRRRQSSWSTPRKIWRNNYATEFWHHWQYVFLLPISVSPPPSPPWK